MGFQLTNNGGVQYFVGTESDDAVSTDPMTGTVNDLYVVGQEKVSQIFLNASAAVTLTGLQAGANGQKLRLTNVSAFSITVAAQNTGSMDVNRFRAGATIHAGNFTDLVYLSAYNRWCIPSGDVSAAEGAGRLLGFQVLTGSGTYTPTVGATSALVIAIGGGGGSGGAKGSASTASPSGGGSAGGMAQLYISPLAANYAYACGTAGTAGAANAGVTPPGNGGTGGTTTFGALLTVPGGGGSAANNNAAISVVPSGAKSTLPTGGTINLSGQVGQPGLNIDVVSGTGTFLGDNASGAGGSTNYGSGGPQQYVSGDGIAGSGYGSGAGGAYAFDSTHRAGAAGQAGVILVWEYS
jgi:hypothetical protein